jgi:2-polyprenyl-3-methyl-5-hydroxy-6-metoxy-1,4-benzoquinol methylase
VFKDNPNNSWDHFGKKNPYYGVLSDEKFRTQNLSEGNRQLFFQSGVEHVDQLLQAVQKHFGSFHSHVKALDFGCGVGRLLIPMAGHFEQVVGMDISSAMISEAKSNLNNMGIQNATLLRSDADLSWDKLQNFDFVHSYIVFQHIPIENGQNLFFRLVDALAPRGIAALHITLFRSSSPQHRLLQRLRKNFVPLNWFINFLRNQPLNEPMMQMNDYNMSYVCYELTRRNINNVHLQLITNADGHVGAYVFFQKC